MTITALSVFALLVTGSLPRVQAPMGSGVPAHGSPINWVLVPGVSLGLLLFGYLIKMLFRFF